MSQTQVGLPALSNEENTVVERFIECSRDVVPGVEVTLAKRIIRPGTNKVVCLAARTSVPLGEDEVASVSDLALRLSDGTNVVLSVSFFNDIEGGATVIPSVIPFERCFYDPNRYSMNADSRFGRVLLATCLIACAGFYSVMTGPINVYQQSKTLLSSIAASSNGPLLRAVAVSPAITLPKAAMPVKTEAPIQKPQKLQKPQSALIESHTPRPVTRSTKPFKVKSSFVRPRVEKASSSHTERDTMFVPPPPATVPYGDPANFNFFGQFPPLPQGMTKANPVVVPEKPSVAKRSKPQASARPTAKQEVPPVVEKAAPVIERNVPVVEKNIPVGERTAPVRLPKIKVEPEVIQVPNSTAVVREYPVVQSELPLERIQTVNGFAVRTAPLPGNNPSAAPAAGASSSQ